MDTSSYIGSTLIGGTLDFPDAVFADRPIVVGAQQINIQGSYSNLINIVASVSNVITGDYVDGVNRNYPGPNMNFP